MGLLERLDEMDRRIDAHAKKAGISDMEIEQALTWLVRKRDIDMLQAMSIIEESDIDLTKTYSQQGQLVFSGKRWQLQGELQIADC